MSNVNFHFGLLVAGLLLGLVSFSSGRALSQEFGVYRLDVGDVLEFSVAGIPDLRQRLTVDLNGHVQIPLAGEVKAAGFLLTELQNLIRDALTVNFYHQRLPDGRNVQLVISREEVALRMLEYRPVYLLGDVARAGEQPYRPGMTVLQAIAMSGGYDVQRFRMSNPFLEFADLRGEIDVLRMEAARGEVVVQRIEAELSNATTFNPKPGEIRVVPELLRDITRTEIQRFETHQSDHRNELVFLRRLIEQTEAKLRTLLDQQRKEEEGARSDVDEAERLRELVQKGLANTARGVETRRMSLLSSTRVLQTSVEVDQTRKEREELIRKPEQLIARRRSELLQELQNASARLATTKARLAAASEKAFYTGVLRSQLVRGKEGKPGITVVRQLPSGRTQMKSSEEAQLLPGDVVEITLSLGQFD